MSLFHFPFSCFEFWATMFRTKPLSEGEVIFHSAPGYDPLVGVDGFWCLQFFHSKAAGHEIISLQWISGNKISQLSPVAPRPTYWPYWDHNKCWPTRHYSQSAQSTLNSPWSLSGCPANHQLKSESRSRSPDRSCWQTGSRCPALWWWRWSPPVSWWRPGSSPATPSAPARAVGILTTPRCPWHLASLTPVSLFSPPLSETRGAFCCVLFVNLCTNFQNLQLNPERKIKYWNKKPIKIKAGSHGNKVICSCKFQLIEIQLDHKLRRWKWIQNWQKLKAVASGQESQKPRHTKNSLAVFVSRTERGKAGIANNFCISWDLWELTLDPVKANVAMCSFWSTSARSEHTRLWASSSSRLSLSTWSAPLDFWFDPKPRFIFTEDLALKSLLISI